MASMKVNKKTVSRWGIYAKESNLDKKNFYIKMLLKNLVSITHRQIMLSLVDIFFQKNIWNIKVSKKGKGGEIHITDAIRKLINLNYKFIGHNFDGKYLDCGTMHGYIKSSLEISKIWNYAWLELVMLA